MLEQFSVALKGLGDFGDKLSEDVKNLVEGALERREAMQRQPQPQRTWEEKRYVYARMGVAPTTLGGDDKTASSATSVSSAPSVSSVQSEGGDSARSNTSERSSQSSLIRVLSKLMGRDNGNAPLNQAPSPFDSKNPEKNNNKESSKSFSAMFTSLFNSAISFFKNLSKEEGAKQEKASSPPESKKGVEKNPQPQQSSSGYGIGGLWKKLIPGGVFVEAENKNTGQIFRGELPFALPRIDRNIRHQVKLPTAKDVKKSAVKSLVSIKANAGNAAVALAGACGVAKEGFTAQNIKDNIGGVASFFASSSPSGSPSASMAQSLRSGAKWLSSSNPGSESMATTTKNAAKALAGIFASSGGSSASYGSGRYSSGVGFDAGLLSR